MERVKSLFSGLVLLAIGLFLALGPAGQDNGRVMCGSQTMSPGDICDTSVNGDSTERTYEEQRATNRRGKIVGMVFGGVLGLIGASLLVAGLLPRRKKQAEPAAPTGPPTPGNR